MTTASATTPATVAAPPVVTSTANVVNPMILAGSGVGAASVPAASAAGLSALRTGHLFLFNSDIRKIACDAWLIPADENGVVDAKWQFDSSLIPQRLPASWGNGQDSGRALPLTLRATHPPAPAGNQPILVHVNRASPPSALALALATGSAGIAPVSVAGASRSSPFPPLPPLMSSEHMNWELAGVTAFVESWAKSIAPPPPPPPTTNAHANVAPPPQSATPAVSATPPDHKAAAPPPTAAVAPHPPTPYKPAYGRSNPLLVLPLIGLTGDDRAQLLPRLIEHCLALLHRAPLAVPANGSGGAAIDIGLVTCNSREFSAAQQIRKQLTATAVLAQPVGSAASKSGGASAGGPDPRVWSCFCEYQGAEKRLELMATAQRYASLASEGNLVLFIGAGISMGAGLPDWYLLLKTLSSEAKLSAAEESALSKLNFLDGARIIQNRLSVLGKDMGQLVSATLKSNYTSPSHVLLASSGLYCDVITTNYDLLIETARRGAQQSITVIPEQQQQQPNDESGAPPLLHHPPLSVAPITIHRILTPAATAMAASAHPTITPAAVASAPVSAKQDVLPVPATSPSSARVRRQLLPSSILQRRSNWLLKMHGCVTRPESIVLSRDHYMNYDDNRSALAGIVQSSLLTKHLLFLGFSLTDYNFMKAISAVRSALGPVSHAAAPAAGAPAPAPAPAAAAPSVASPSTKRVLGSALYLHHDDIFEELWKGDLVLGSIVDVARLPPDLAGAKFPVAARQQEIFFDYMVSLASTSTPILLDARYRHVLSAADSELCSRLYRFLDDMSSNPSALQSDTWQRIQDYAASLGLYRYAPPPVTAVPPSLGDQKASAPKQSSAAVLASLLSSPPSPTDGDPNIAATPLAPEAPLSPGSMTTPRGEDSPSALRATSASRLVLTRSPSSDLSPVPLLQIDEKDVAAGSVGGTTNGIKPTAASDVDSIRRVQHAVRGHQARTAAAAAAASQPASTTTAPPATTSATAPAVPPPVIIPSTDVPVVAAAPAAAVASLPKPTYSRRMAASSARPQVSSARRVATNSVPPPAVTAPPAAVTPPAPSASTTSTAAASTSKNPFRRALDWVTGESTKPASPQAPAATPPVAPPAAPVAPVAPVAPTATVSTAMSSDDSSDDAILAATEDIFLVLIDVLHTTPQAVGGNPGLPHQPLLRKIARYAVEPPAALGHSTVVPLSRAVSSARGGRGGSRGGSGVRGGLLPTGPPRSSRPLPINRHALNAVKDRAARPTQYTPLPADQYDTSGAGHVYVVCGDLRRLSCDAWLVPTSAIVNISQNWFPSRYVSVASSVEREPVPPELKPWEHALFEAASNQSQNRRCGRLENPLVNAAVPVPTSVVGSFEDIWDSVVQFILTARREVDGKPPRHGRARYLFALPVVATGKGGKLALTGFVLERLFPILTAAVQVASLCCDIVLVCYDEPTFVAAQYIRLQSSTLLSVSPAELGHLVLSTTPSAGLARGGANNPWPLLAPGSVGAAKQLASRHAVRDNLVLFLGEQITGSGHLVPKLADLPRRVAETYKLLTSHQLAQLSELPLLDQARVVTTRLAAAAAIPSGGDDSKVQRPTPNERFLSAIATLLHTEEYSLSHMLCALLPCKAVVSSAVDNGFEHCWENLTVSTQFSGGAGNGAGGVQYSILPNTCGESTNARWLLKLNGSVDTSQAAALIRAEMKRASNISQAAKPWHAAGNDLKSDPKKSSAKPLAAAGTAVSSRHAGVKPIVLLREQNSAAREAVEHAVLEACLVLKHVLFVGVPYDDTHFSSALSSIQKIIKSSSPNRAWSSDPICTVVGSGGNTLLSDALEPQIRVVTPNADVDSKLMMCGTTGRANSSNSSASDSKSPTAAAAATALAVGVPTKLTAAMRNAIHARYTDMFLDCLVAHVTADTLPLLDTRFRSLLTAEEKQIEAALSRLLNSLSSSRLAKRSAAYPSLVRLLSSLGDKRSLLDHDREREISHVVPAASLSHAGAGSPPSTPPAAVPTAPPIQS